jgi:hypothetical protein
MTNETECKPAINAELRKQKFSEVRYSFERIIWLTNSNSEASREAQRGLEVLNEFERGREL